TRRSSPSSPFFLLPSPFLLSRPSPFVLPKPGVEEALQPLCHPLPVPLLRHGAAAAAEALAEVGVAEELDEALAEIDGIGRRGEEGVVGDVVEREVAGDGGEEGGDA